MSTQQEPTIVNLYHDLSTNPTPIEFKNPLFKSNNNSEIFIQKGDSDKNKTLYITPRPNSWYFLHHFSKYVTSTINRSDEIIKSNLLGLLTSNFNTNDVTDFKIGDKLFLYNPLLNVNDTNGEIIMKGNNTEPNMYYPNDETVPLYNWPYIKLERENTRFKKIADSATNNKINIDLPSHLTTYLVHVVSVEKKTSP